jgi:hypothetical protein
MTVRELIRELLKHDTDMIVAIETEEEVINIDRVRIVRQEGCKDKITLS